MEKAKKKKKINPVEMRIPGIHIVVLKYSFLQK